MEAINRGGHFDFPRIPWFDALPQLITGFALCHKVENGFPDERRKRTTAKTSGLIEAKPNPNKQAAKRARMADE